MLFYEITFDKLGTSLVHLCQAEHHRYFICDVSKGASTNEQLLVGGPGTPRPRLKVQRDCSHKEIPDILAQREGSFASFKAPFP